MREILEMLNEWWVDGSISNEKAKPYRRKVFHELENLFFNYRQIILISGLRRVGKTTLMYQLIEELLKRDVNHKNILYFSFDERIEDPLRILEEYEVMTKVNWKRERVYIFLDEIHKLEGWSSKIKLLYDSLPNVKLCVSGSANIGLWRDALKDLAGRFFSVEVKPLTLQEFAELYYNRPVESYELYHSRLKAIFDDYVRRPFPEIVKWSDKRRINEYIRELVVEKIVKSDIPQSFEGINLKLLMTLLNIFMRDVGTILNLTELAKDLGVHKQTLSRHISYLEFGKVVKSVTNFRPSVRAESRKMRKIYPYHPSLAYPYNPSIKAGSIFENLVMASLALDKYWRHGSKEVDFLKVDGDDIIPIEVKAKDTLKKGDLKPLLYFMRKFSTKLGYVIYSGPEKEMKFDDRMIKLVPIMKVLFANQLS